MRFVFLRHPSPHCHTGESRYPVPPCHPAPPLCHSRAGGNPSSHCHSDPPAGGEESAVYSYCLALSSRSSPRHSGLRAGILCSLGEILKRVQDDTPPLCHSERNGNP